jgi:hypothetical protein
MLDLSAADGLKRGVGEEQSHLTSADESQLSSNTPLTLRLLDACCEQPFKLTGAFGLRKAVNRGDDFGRHICFGLLHTSPSTPKEGDIAEVDVDAISIRTTKD